MTTMAAVGVGFVAVLGLFQYALLISTGRLSRDLNGHMALFFLGAGVGAATVRLASRHGKGKTQARPSLPVPAASAPAWIWDALAGFFVLTLLIPTVFPYVHFDAKVTWACRAYAMGQTESISAVAACKLPNYPPLFSILLWIGIDDPVFEGRLLVFLLHAFFAVLMRERLIALAGRDAGPALVFLLSTVHVWQGSATYYANVPLMIFLTAGALLTMDVAWLPKRGFAERLSGAACLAAAVLTRQDGIVYLGVLVIALLLSRLRVPWVSLAIAVAATASWSFRPAALMEPNNFFTAATGAWRSASSSTAIAIVKTLGVFLDGLQGQWLSHKGFGLAFYVAVGIAALAWPRRRDQTANDPESQAARFFGLVTLGSLGAVVLCYVLVPFTGDPVSAAQPFEGTYLESYLHFIRVGLGRMTVHLYPFAILWGAATLACSGSGETGVESALES